jgi:hypothetical protein
MDLMADRAMLGGRTRRRRRGLIAALLGLSLMTVGAGAFSLAIWTDSKTNAGSFATGSIILGVSPATVFTATNILPGDSGSQDVTVSNAGLSQFRYAMSTAISAETNSLANGLTLTVKNAACASVGSTIYTGTLRSAALGDPTQGAQAGDRTLGASSSETLCFTWALPGGAAQSYQGSTATATFTFAAEQTANN